MEDEAVGLFVLQKYLEAFGEIETARDGQRGLELFQEALKDGNPFSLVMMDIMLPKLDGQSVLREIRESERTSGVKPVEAAKVVMTTALSDPKNIIKAFNEGGADSYLLKPIDKRKLIDELQKIGFSLEVKR
ncbi:MAG: response regulator [Sediminispirochaetaceae bacterium]